MPTHRRPSGRPVHPECPKLDRRNEPCKCDELWDHWDGTDASLDEIIRAESKSDMRRWPHAYEYDFSDDTFGGVDRVYSHNSEGLPEGLHYDPDNETRGFWKESEMLKTVRKSRPDNENE